MTSSPGPQKPPAEGAALPAVGTVLQGRYRIVSRIGEGGMGVIFEGERLGLGRAVAIKFLHAALAREEQVCKRFEVEARAMSRLGHPNCVSVIDFGVETQLPYLVMDVVRGPSLRELIDAGRLPTARALAITGQILTGLAHAHQHGIVHRDIKPENIVLEEGAGLVDHVRILDFGLAKLRDSSSALTVGIAVGTPNYMAPEQMREGPVDERLDIYAVGLLLFEMLTGKKPFDSSQIGEIFLRQQTMPPPRLQDVVPEKKFSPSLEALVRRALEKAPEARFASALAMSQALEVVMTGTNVAVIAPKGPPPGMPGRKHLDPTIAESAPWGLQQAARSKKEGAPSDAATTLFQPPPGGAKGNVAAVARMLAAALQSGARRLGAVGAAGYRWARAARKRTVGAASAAAVALIAILFLAGRPAPRRVVPAGNVPAPSYAPLTPADNPKLAKALALAARGERDKAIAMLVDLRRQSPREADYPAALARLYFEKRSWSQGLSAFRAAIRLDPQRRTDGALIGHVITSLQVDRFANDAEDFLRELGPAARAEVKQAAKSHASPRVRSRCRDLLETWDHKPLFRFR